MLSDAPCLADAGLSLQFVGSPSGPFPQGQNVQVKVRMTGVPVITPAAGFQAFLHFDSSRLTFVNGAYSSSPFGLFILNPIVGSGEDINLAAGINTFGGQLPSAADADLVTLTFQVNSECGMGAVTFRSNNPPTRLSDPLGQAITPITLSNLNTIITCPGDLVATGVVDVSDLLSVITHWGSCPPTPACCAGNANGDSVVDVSDLLVVITGWGACP